MKVMIMEDEPSNVKRICRLLKIVDNDIDIVFIAESVEESVRFLTSGNIMPDLIFADIQLADGLCFTVFDKVKTDIPVIFITAFDNYALKAFEYNSLSYIIKPVTEKELRMAMEKVRRIAHPFSVPDIMTQLHRMASGQGLYLNRVLLEQPDGFVPADVEEICLVEAECRSTKIWLEDGRSGLSDHPLKYFEDSLDPKRFVRVSRQEIIAPAKVSAYRRRSFRRYVAEFRNLPGKQVELSPEKFREIKMSFE